jgi:hypothetical protein
MVIGRDSSTAFVQFDIKWENSWRYTNVNHDAALDSATGNANVPNWPGTGSSTRGGDWSDAAIMARSSDRWVACYGYADSASGRVGGRAVRTAPSGVGP